MECLRVMDDTWEFICERPNAYLLDDWALHLTTQGDWIHYDYRTHVQFQVVPESVQILLDDIESRGSFMAGMQLQLFVNEQPVSLDRPGSYIDPKWKTFPIAPYLKSGTNEIRLRFTNQSWAGEPKGMSVPPKLLGDFRLTTDASGQTVLMPHAAAIRSGQSWTDQGYPFYSGTAHYTQRVHLDTTDLAAEQIWIELTGVADMVEFVVNGQPAGVRPWPPYRCEVRPLLRPGANQITLKVTNSMQNFLEGKPKSSGILGSVHLHRR